MIAGGLKGIACRNRGNDDCPALAGGGDKLIERTRARRREIGALSLADLGRGDFRQFLAAGAGRDVVHLLTGGSAAVFFPKQGDLLLDASAAFRGDRPVLGADASDLESLNHAPVVPGRLDLVPGLQHASGEFVLVDFARVANCADHLSLCEGKPPFGLGVVGRVGGDEVRVQLRVEGA